MPQLSIISKVFYPILLGFFRVYLQYHTAVYLRKEAVKTMKEQLYTIPVNDAFSSDCECPLCAMNRELEKNAIEYTMGPSYMEDDNRAMTDKLGFCSKHIMDLYHEKNRLGLALMLNTHINKVTKDLKECASKKHSSGKLFQKNNTGSPVSDYIRTLESQCFICQRIHSTFDRYIETIFHLWKKDEAFVETVKNSRGFCISHYGYLYEAAGTHLSGGQYDEFIKVLNQIFFQNLERVNEDVGWFINKFDYRYQNEPWKNAKDALPRAVIKTNHIIPED